MTNEEAAALTERAMKIIESRQNEPMKFQFSVWFLFGLIGQLQIAFRHPGNNGLSRQTTESFVLDLIERIDPSKGDVYKLLMLGFNGRFDQPPPEPRELDWTAAKAHLDVVIAAYESFIDTPGVNTKLALEYVLRPLAKRFDEGERSEKLFNEMMNVE